MSYLMADGADSDQYDRFCGYDRDEDPCEPEESEESEFIALPEAWDGVSEPGPHCDELVTVIAGVAHVKALAGILREHFATCPICMERTGDIKRKQPGRETRNDAGRRAA